MIKILRITQHEVTKSQLAELSRIFEYYSVNTVNETLPRNPREAVARFDELVVVHAANVVEAVLPTNLWEAVLKYSTFVKNGGMVIKAEMNRELVEGKAKFTFSHYVKVLKVEIVTESL